MHPFDAELYYEDIIARQGRVFLWVRDELSGVDEKWFIENYMRSEMRRLLDNANPKFAAMSSPELIYWFVHFEQGGRFKEYKRGDTWGGFLPQWVGHMYAHYQWQYNVASDHLIDILPLSEMERIFPALHQTGWHVAAQKIHDEILSRSH